MTDVFNASATPDPTPSGDDRLTKLEQRLNDKDEFIEQLKTETAQMREELRNRDKGFEELNTLRDEIARLKANEPAPQAKHQTGAELTDTDIEALVAKAITKQEMDRSTAANIKVANDQMVKVYGTVDKAMEALNVKAAELGMSVDVLRDTASLSPTAFFRLVGVDPSSTQKDTFDKRSSVNSEGVNLTGEPRPGTKEYFDNIRREKGSSYYFKPAIQNQIVAAMKAGTYKTKG